MIFSNPQFLIILGLAATLCITTTLITGSRNIDTLVILSELENIVSIAERLHDEIIGFHNEVVPQVNNIINNPQNFTSSELRSIHDALCQLLASINNISPGFDFPLYILNNFEEQDMLSDEGLELIERFDIIKDSFIQITEEVTKVIQYIEQNSTGYRFFTRS